MEGQEGLLRAYGLREVATGMLSLSIEKTAKRGSRVAGAKSVRATHPRRGLGLGILPMARGQWTGCDHSAIADNALHQDRFTF